MSRLNVVRGTNDKPAASQALIEAFTQMPDADGQLFIGYPVLGSADGRHPIDAVFVSPHRGVIVFDLVEGQDIGDYQERQDEAATRIQQRLLGYRELVRRRDLQIDISSVTFAPTGLLPEDEDQEYLLAQADSLEGVLAGIFWSRSSHELYERTLSAIQNISSIRGSRTARVIKSSASRGARLQRLENQIATLDTLQSKAVIETVDGVQRIRGLAGSGKTIVLALKAAYLHAQHPEWKIAITFNTRSLKDQFKRFITSFCIESSGEEPNWDNVRIVNSWGAPGSADRGGLYYDYCAYNGAPYYDFRSARDAFGREEAFGGACAAALAAISQPKTLYDAILVDEAQDLPATFLRLCYSMLDENRRLVYAYDELQTLSGSGLPSAEEIFGLDSRGRPEVTFDLPPEAGARRDIVLEKCYRNSRPVLVSAHALGFGIYRKSARVDRTGLVQMFNDPKLWTDVGYVVTDGSLESGRQVVLQRTEESSPKFLEAHSDVSDLIKFMRFDSKREQDDWVASQIETNLREEELRHDDIVVINTDPIKTRTNVGPIRSALLERNIPNHLAGVDTKQDVFFMPGQGSVTFTGVYRAKGNEAGMIYIVNAEECQSSDYNLSRVRNRLFTAMTRSKAWVRVLGVGHKMDQLIEEYEAVRKAHFELDFKYPTAAERERLQIIHRDMTASGEQHRDQREESVVKLLRDFETGVLFPEDLDPSVLDRLRRAIGDADL